MVTPRWAGVHWLINEDEPAVVLHRLADVLRHAPAALRAGIPARLLGRFVVVPYVDVGSLHTRPPRVQILALLARRGRINSTEARRGRCLRRHDICGDVFGGGKVDQEIQG